MLAGALTAAQAEVERLRGELRKIMEHTLAGVIRVENGQPNGLDATMLDNIARAALAPQEQGKKESGK